MKRRPQVYRTTVARTLYYLWQINNSKKHELNEDWLRMALESMRDTADKFRYNSDDDTYGYDFWSY